MAGVSLPTTIPGTYVPYVSNPPAPTPSFVSATAGISHILTLTSLQAGDLILFGYAGLNTPLPNPGLWFNVAASGLPPSNSPVFGYWLHVVTPQDTGTFDIQVTSAGAYAAAAFRAAKTPDASTFVLNKPGASTQPVSASFTTAGASDILVNLLGWDVGGSNVNLTSNSTGYTLAARQNGVTTVNFGVAIEYKLGAAAGVQPASSGAVLDQNIGWGVYALGLDSV